MKVYIHSNKKPNKTMKKGKQKRLEELLTSKFLSSRIFPRISENMHYEIFQYLNCKDLLEIRSSKLGGFQLISNRLLRSRIKNYFFSRIHPNLKENLSTTKYDKRMKLLFSQTDKDVVDLESSKLTFDEIKNLLRVLELNPQIRGINLSMDIYIYIL